MAHKKVKVGLVQINNSFSGQNYLPLSVALLQAYAERQLKRPEDFEFQLPIYRRIPVREAVDSLLSNDVVFFSTYVWDIRISLEIAKTLKSLKPEVLIVFGGPQVPDYDEGFLSQHPFIDLACHGEGEQAAVAVLENFRSKNWQPVPSISFLKEDGTLARNPKSSRISDLSNIPSPYLEGIFEPLMKANPQEKWIVLWETNRGCPFSCTFCDWGSATQSKVYPIDLERLYREVEWFSEHKIEFIFCCDANFGILPRDIDIATFVAEIKKKSGYPMALSVQNTKNVTERAYKVQKILADAGLNKGVAMALQSVDPDTLKSIKRDNISTASYQELQRRFTRDNVETYSDLILALPGETYDSFADGVSDVMANGQHNRIQFNNLSILPNAEMGDPAYQKKYGMVTVETKIINVHGSLYESKEEIYETQLLVVGTNAMPKEDWVKTRAFAWMTALLHFDKLLQIPLILIHEICPISYRELLELFSADLGPAFPIFSEIQSFFKDKARDIQNGGPEYCASEPWLNMWWPADEYIFIKLCTEDKLDAFYKEAEQLLDRFMKESFIDLRSELQSKSIQVNTHELLCEAIRLNRALLKQPFQNEDVVLDLSYNIWEFYQSILKGTEVHLAPKRVRYHIDCASKQWLSWDEWCREVVWYGHRRGAYLYGNNTVETELAGHY